MYLSAANTIKLAAASNPKITIDANTSIVSTGFHVTGQNTVHGVGRLAIGYEGSSKNQIRCYGANDSTKGTLEFKFTTSDGSANDPDITFAAGGATFGATCTATTFIGALTGTASGNPTLAAGSDNRLITATGANTLTGETALTFDGNALRVGGATHGSHSTFSDIFLGGAAHLYAETTGAAGNSLSISQNAHVDSDGSWEYIVTDEASNIYQYSGKIGFRTAASGTAGNDISWEERLLITATGEILIGRSAKPNDINKLVITGTSPADEYDSTLYLEGNETSGAANTGGALAFGGHDNTAFRNWGNIYGMKENGTGGNTASYMSFHTRADGGNPAEKLRITSTGSTRITKANVGVVSGALQINTTLANYGTIQVRDSNQANIAALQVENANNGANETNKVIRSVNLNSAAWANAAYHAKEHKFRINGETDTENIVLINSNGLQLAATKGIDFSPYTAAASGSGSPDPSSNLLDDYEEGTFTPTNSIGLTLTNNTTAHYTKIGRLVHIQLDISFSGAADTSQCAMIQSLPFTSLAGNVNEGSIQFISNTGDAKWDYDDDNTRMFIAASESRIDIKTIIGGTTQTRSWAVGRRIRVSMNYLAA
jgi:hypothetical protein